MARYEHLPIYKTATETGLLIQSVAVKFSRYNKYSIGDDLREASRRIILLIVWAAMDGSSGRGISMRFIELYKHFNATK